MESRYKIRSILHTALWILVVDDTTMALCPQLFGKAALSRELCVVSTVLNTKITSWSSASGTVAWLREFKFYLPVEIIARPKLERTNARRGTSAERHGYRVSSPTSMIIARHRTLSPRRAVRSDLLSAHSLWRRHALCDSQLPPPHQPLMLPLNHAGALA